MRTNRETVYLEKRNWMKNNCMDISSDKVSWLLGWLGFMAYQPL